MKHTHRARAVTSISDRTGAVTSISDPPLGVPRPTRFADRRDAGRKLARLLERFRDQKPVIVAIPRGGVPVAAEVARALGAPLDVAVVRKLGAPRNPEFAIGAIAEGGVQLLNAQTVKALGIADSELQAMISRLEGELAERTAAYRQACAAVDLHGRTAILIDDGLATGRSAQAALRSVRARGARRVILAVPVAAPESAIALSGEADEIVCVERPEDMWAVGLWYRDFSPTSDEQVRALLQAARSAHEGPTDAFECQDVLIPAGDGVLLGGELTVPPAARVVVAFAHGSGSSRLSPRNRRVASALNDAGCATLLFDLLTPNEEIDRRNVFDVELLASRLIAASAWLSDQALVRDLPLAYFGASTGAAAALTAAARLPEGLCAVVSRGGRPDLALGLPAVQAPTLLIVGEDDAQVLALNRHAQRLLRCPCELAVVPRASHLFEEPGTLEQVARLAIDWLKGHCAASLASPPPSRRASA